MPVGGKLVFKGGDTLGGIVKKKKKKKPKAVVEDIDNAAGDAEAEKQHNSDGQQDEQSGAQPPKKPIDPLAVNVLSGKTYEQEFDIEMRRTEEGKTKSTPWGSSYRAPPEILHGYDRKVTGVTAEERLDLRSAKKSDKFCK